MRLRPSIGPKQPKVDRAKEMLQSVQAKKEQALARIDQAKAEVAQAQILVDYGRIYSPLRGVVASKQAEVGALAAPGGARFSPSKTIPTIDWKPTWKRP